MSTWQNGCNLHPEQWMPECPYCDGKGKFVDDRIGVIVARFQVAELHEGHRALLDYVIPKHKQTLVILGVSPVPATRHNPLSYQQRVDMLLEFDSFLNIVSLNDCSDDDLWSSNLDDLVTRLYPGKTAVLYGGPDSGALDSYTGHLPVEHLPHLVGDGLRGSDHRANIRAAHTNSYDFRAGVIWATDRHFPTVYPTVDLAILSPNHRSLLLGQKPGEKMWRLPGGFADPDNNSYEFDATREAFEEIGLNLATYELRYLGSFPIDDWRYRNEPDTVKTLLFGAVAPTTDVNAGDDLARVKWFDRDILNEALEEYVYPIHQPLVRRALERM